MSQTALTMATVMKDIWTAERLQKQFEDKNAPLGRLEAVRGVMIGNQAQVPIHAGRAGSFTTVGAGGGALNPATAQPVNAGPSTRCPTTGSRSSLRPRRCCRRRARTCSPSSAAKDLEIQGAVENTKHQITRMMVTNGDGIVAACDTTASANTIKLVAAAGEGAAYGYSALVRGWLPSGATTGQYVDIGTTADTDALATGVQVTGVAVSPDRADDHHLGLGDRHHARDALRLHRQPELDDRLQPGGQRSASDRRHGRLRRPEPRHGGPGVVEGRSRRHDHDHVLA